ncbi:MAG: protein-disulfide reductase DsbD family protein [Amphiplicatus sp.]
MNWDSTECGAPTSLSPTEHDGAGRKPARAARGALLGLFAILLTLAGPAAAASFVKTDHAQSRLVPAREGFAPGETAWFALAQELQQGWHVYWKNPGDSGLALELEWSLPDGYAAGEIVYPTPERLPVGPLVNFGHHGAPIFLVPVTAPENAAGEAEIALTARWLICEEICVPEEAVFSLTLPVAAAPPAHEEGAALVAKARAASPAPLGGKARFSADAERLVLRVPAPAGVRDAFFFPDAEGLIEPAAPQPFAVKDGALTIAMTPGLGYEPARLEALKGVIVLSGPSGERRGYDLSAAKSAEAIAPPAAPSLRAPQANAAGGRALPVLLLTAFLGGVILNVMPCVFPILFIKAASLMKQAGAHPALARRDGLLFGAGVLLTYAALGALLLTLRAGGEAVGWGFQLQSPAVVLLSAYVLFLVGLNLAGVFHVGTGLQNVGGGLAAKGGAAGAFFTGVLAVFVAAPCIGPLLSAPMGAAVMLPPLAGMLIFIALALGFAAPFMAVSFAPGLGRRLPKPGPWMTTFKQALSFPVFAAAAYFLWVLAEQTGRDGLAQALGGAVLVAFAAWLFEQSKGGRAFFLRTLAGLAALIALAPLFAFAFADQATPSRKARDGAYGGVETLAFAPERIETLRAEGRPIFVDFTAAWCVVCQFNKATILSKPSITEAFKAKDVALMVADWTRRDPEIADALARFGANGVPLYVYYPPAGEPQVLSLPLSARAILNAIGS